MQSFQRKRQIEEVNRTRENGLESQVTMSRFTLRVSDTSVGPHVAVDGPGPASSITDLRVAKVSRVYRNTLGTGLGVGLVPVYCSISL